MSLMSRCMLHWESTLTVPLLMIQQHFQSLDFRLMLLANLFHNLLQTTFNGHHQHLATIRADARRHESGMQRTRFDCSGTPRP